MAASILDRFKAIDTDTHITEPPDVWTSRVPKKWSDVVPHVKRIDGRDVWIVAGEPAGAPGAVTMAGFDGTVPESRKTYEDCPPAAFDAKARLAFMDAEGIHAQVLYPNVGGFGSGRFLSLKEPELMLACVRAYNDFLVEWCSADRSRLVPVMAGVFWDVGQWVGEIERCAAKGYKALLACGQPQSWAQPPLCSTHWDPVWSAARDTGMSVSFHIGSGDLAPLFQDASHIGFKANFARISSTMFVDNCKCIADLIFGGVCHRFPEVPFVSVESGVGWLRGVLEAMDWQWRNSGIAKEHPDWDLLPSEYFQRQIYGCFWFEEDGIQDALRRFPNNFMWETDYPHPTCNHVGPQTPARGARGYVDAALGGLPDDLLQKVLHDTAARLYGLA